MAEELSTNLGATQKMNVAKTVIPDVSTAFRVFCLAVFFVIGLQTLYAVPFGIIAKISEFSAPVRAIFSAIICATTIVAGVFLIRFGVARYPTLGESARQIRSKVVWTVVVAGLAARILIIVFATVAPASDAKAYMQLGQILANNDPYFFSGRWAYWPVGYPFILSTWFRMFGPTVGSVQILNLLLYLVACSGILALAKAWQQENAGKLAVLAFACWLDLIVLTAWPSKELVAIALIPWVLVLCACQPVSISRKLIARAVAGSIAGLLVLVQPSFLLLIPVIPLVTAQSNGQRYRSTLIDVAIVTFAAMLTVAPWTIRNYQVFGEFIPVATNGGEVFYRANNPLATGGYIKRGEVDLWDLPELAAHQEGARLAKQWILANPGEFIGLVVRKQLLFLEDDSIGVYEVFSRGHIGAPISETTYLFSKLACVIYWYLLWAIFSSALYILIKMRQWQASGFLFLAMPLLYLYGIHSIFESGPRYHQPASAVLVLAIAATFLAATRALSVRIRVEGQAQQ